jgi:Arginine degradation protein (predicted deacylase)
MEAQQGCLGILCTLQYNIDLAPYDFHVFPKLKEQMIHHFLSDDEVICDYLNTGGSAWITGVLCSEMYV